MLYVMIIILLILILIYINYNKNNKYNVNGKLIENKDIDNLVDDINSLNIIKLNNNDINFNNYSNIDNINNYKTIIQDTSNLFPKLNDKFIYKINYSMTKNIKINELKFAHNKYNIICNIQGNTKFYLINPKHKNDIIKNKTTENKKYSHIIELNKNDILIIPKNWYYFFESNNNYTLLHIDYQTYYTFLYDFIKNKYIL